VNDLIARGDKVVVLDDLSGGFEHNVNPKAIFVHGSILDHELLSNLFITHSVDFVYHLAAYAAEGLSHFIRRFNYTNNLVGSVNLINESVKHKVRCFVFTSSIAVYGKGQLPMREDLTPLPEDPYGIAKLAVEQDLLCAHEMFGLNSIIFRPHNVYGEYQNLGDKYRNVVGIFMNQLMQGIPLSIFGDGNQTRAFSYIGDISPVIAQSVHTEAAYNRTFNIGADVEYTVNQLAHEICEVMGTPGQINFLPARNEVQHAYADHSLVKSIFPSQTSTPLRDGLARMAAWAKMEGVKKSMDFDPIEIKENLPPSWLS
jgi:UDP-glucose 4-epimerase